jgi:NAD(P)-dependent dehydrogenase (short-subunit alcohol dehydrogenase family)
MTVSKPLTIIAGLGPGLGLSLAKNFIEQGYEVVGLSRYPMAETKDLHTMTLDMADEAQIKASFSQIDAQFQRAPVVVIHNPAELIINPFLDHSSDDFEKTWRSMVLSAVLLSAECIPRMLSHDRGCMIFSGATAGIRAGAGFAAFASAKFALRGLTQSLAREFHPQGIHITHVILDGLIWSQRTQERFSPEQESCMLPEDIAEVYWHITQQPRSTWSQEIDLRPDVESF